MATGTVEELQERLAESEGKTAKLKTILVALKAKSSQVQTLCKQQTEQLEKDRLTIERYSREEAHLLRRCEELETRNKELERDKAERDQQSARQGAPTEHEVLRDFQQGLAHKRQAEGGSDDAVMQSAVSVCEGALGILKAALAGALTGTQNTNNAAGSLSLEPRHHRSGKAATSIEHDREEGPLLSRSGSESNAAELQVEKKKLGTFRVANRGRKRTIHELENAASDLDRIQEQARHTSELAKVQEDFSVEGLSAMDITQHWLAKLTGSHATEEMVEHVAARILLEIRVTKRCPIQCFTTCLVLSVINCASGSGNLAPSVWQDSSNDTASSKSPVLNLCMLDDTQIEDVILSKAWYADEHATRHSLTNLLAFIASLDRQAGSPSPGSTTEYSEAVENELRRIILVEHRQRASALECEDSALTTALILLLRMRGSLQAARTFLLDLLASSTDNIEQTLPCIAATFAAWPDLLGGYSSEGTKSVVSLLQEGLQAVCQGVLHDLDGDGEDASTSAGSMSGTTLPAASRGGLAVAAKYMLQLGKARWGWQESSGGLEGWQRALQDRWKADFWDPLRPGDAAAPDDAALGTLTCSSYITASFLGLPWISEEVISKTELLELANKGSVASKVTQAAAEYVLQKVLDVLQISLTGVENANQQMHSIWTDFSASDACPQPIAARLRTMLDV